MIEIMDAFWTFLIILTVVFFLFVVLPSLVAPSSISAHPRAYTHPSKLSPPSYATSVASRDLEAEKSQTMLATYYVNARNVVPEDYPRQRIGTCPYSKPPSTDLPIVDTPMCITARSLKDLQ